MTRAPLGIVVLAVLLPLLVGGAGYAYLRRPQDAVGPVAQFARHLADHPTPVLVFGSSLAHRGIDEGVLARELDLQPRDVAMLHMPHSEAAHWYAVLKNKVYANGHEPELILMVGALTTFLNHEVLGIPSNVERLVEQLQEDEPVIARKVFGFDDGQAFRRHYLRARASRVRADLLSGVRDRVIANLFTHAGKADEAAALAEKVNEEVFANARMDYGLHDATPTGLYDPPARFTFDVDREYVLREQALLDDIQELVASHGARVVWVRMPFPPSNPDMDVVPPEVEEDAMAWLDELGAGYLDMRTLDLDDSLFEDMRHLSPKGATIFSQALGRSLVAMDALGEGAGVGVIRGLDAPRRAAVVGKGPTLPGGTVAGCRSLVRHPQLDAFGPEGRRAVGAGVPWPVWIEIDGHGPLDLTEPGEGCVGGLWHTDGALVVSPPKPGARWQGAVRPSPITSPDGEDHWWIAPGQKAVFAYDEGWELPPHTFRVFARGTALGEGAGDVVVSAGGHRFTLARDGRRLAGAAPLPPPEGAWKLEVVVPEDGPWVLLHHLAVGMPPTTTHVVGDPETLHGASVRVVGGRLSDVQMQAAFGKAPPAFPYQPELRRGPRNVGILPLPKLVQLSDAPDKDVARPNRCSPLRVLEDGEPLPLHHSVCYDVLTKGRGRYCHADKAVYLSASDDSDPLTNGRRYSLELTNDRRCDTYAQSKGATLRGSWWLYPGDTLRFPIPPDRLHTFDDGANTLEVELIGHVAPAEVPLEIALLRGEETVFQAPMEGAAVGRRRRSERWSLPEPLPPRAEDLSLVVRNPSKTSFQLLSLATLAERYDLFSGGDRAVSDDATADEDSAAAEVVLDGSLQPSAVTREGGPPPIETPKPYGWADDATWEARLFALWPLSITAMDNVARGAWTPVRLSADGNPLLGVDRKAFIAGCTGCYHHVGQSFYVRAPAADEAALEVTLVDDFPAHAPDGTLWWVYPGNTVTVAFDTPWEGGRVEIVGEAWAFQAKRELAADDLYLRAEGRSVAFTPTETEGLYAARLVIEEPADGPWTFEVADGSTRSVALLRSLRVTDASGTSEVLRDVARP